MIGTRILTATVDGKELSVAVVVDAPQGEGDDWMCAFRISWPDRTVERYARGVDGLQAAYLAQEMIGAAIYASDLHKQGKLKWRRPENGYGFPVPRAMKDLLIGDDLTFEG